MIKQSILKVNQNISILKHINPKKEYGIFVTEYEFIETQIDEVIYILNDTIKDCRRKYFHTFGYSCVYDIKFINMENFVEDNLTITLVFAKFKSQLYGLDKKSEMHRKMDLDFVK